MMSTDDSPPFILASAIDASENTRLRDFLIHQYQIPEARHRSIPTIPPDRFLAIAKSIHDRYSCASAKSIYDESGERISEGSYATVWRKMRKTHESGPLSPYSPAVPWITFDSANDYVQEVLRTSKGGKSTIAITISSMNFVLNQQHELGKHMLANENPPLRLLTHKDGLSGSAMRTATARTVQYPLIRTVDVSQRVRGEIRQRDPHRGRIFRALTDEELTNVNLWFLKGKVSNVQIQNKPIQLRNITRKFQGYDRFDLARNRAMFSLSHFALTRSDDVRSNTASLSSIGWLPIPQVYSRNANKGYVFFLLKDESKTNKKGWTQFAGCLRHKNPLFCCFNALAEYLLLAYGKNGRRTFPDIEDQSVDWTASTILFSDSHGNSISYSKKKKKQQTEDTNNGQYDDFILMKKAVGLDHLIKATHYRLWGSMYGQDRGASEKEMEKLGRWAIEGDVGSVCRQFYLRNIDMKAALAQADYLPDSIQPTHCYRLPRGMNMDVGDINKIEGDIHFAKVLNHIFPGILEKYKTALEHQLVSETNERVCLTIIILLCSWIQDAVVLLDQYPDLMSSEPYSYLFDDVDVARSFESIAQDVRTFTRNEVSIFASATQIERQDVLTAINLMGGSIKEHNELTVRSELSKNNQLWLKKGLQLTHALNDAFEIRENESEMRTNDMTATTTELQSGQIINSEEASTINLSQKYTLQNCKGIEIVRYVEEWEREVIPRIQAGNTTWWGHDDCRQFRFQRKKLYEVLAVGNESVALKAKSFEEHCRSIANITWSDVVALMVLAEKKTKENNPLDIFDSETMKDIVKKRKYLQSKEGRESRKRKKADGVNVPSESQE